MSRRFPRLAWAALAASVAGAALAVFPVTPASASATPPPGGPVTIGTNGLQNNRGIYCNFVIAGPPGYVAPQTSDGLVAVVRCYGTPTTANVNGMSVILWTSQTQGGTGAARVIFSGDMCTESGSHDPTKGRFQLTCVMPDAETAVGSSEGYFINKGPGASGGAGYANNYYARITINLDAAPFSYSNIYSVSGTDVEKWNAIGVWQQYLTASPHWPGWWPTTVTQPVTPDELAEVHPPKLECSGRLRQEADGTVKATAQVFVLNGQDRLTTEEIDLGMEAAFHDTTPEWGYEWDESGGEPSSSTWWDGRPTDEGTPLRNVVVPKTGVPDGGWTVAVRVKRIIDNTGDVRGGGYPEFPDGVPEAGSGGGGFWIPQGFEWKYVPGLGWIWVPSTANGNWVPDENGTGTLPSSWSSVYSVCTMKLDPSKVGGPLGDGGGGTGGEPVDEDGGPRDNEPPTDGEEEPDEGCAIPEGWSVINPLAWGEQLGCILGGLFDDLIDFFSWIKDWIGGLAGWLQGLIVPDGDFMEAKMEQLTDAWNESGFGSAGEAIGEALSALGSIVTTAKGGGAGCEGPAFDFPIPTRQPVRVALLKSCSGIGATAANWAQVIGSLTVLVGAAMLAGRIALGSIGVTIGSGRGE